MRAALSWIEVVCYGRTGGFDAHEGHGLVAVTKEEAEALVVPVGSMICFRNEIIGKYKSVAKSYFK